MFKLIRGLVIPIFILIALAVIGLFINDSISSSVSNAKVIELQNFQKISGSDGNISTEYRFLVVTNKGTFICKSNFIKGKFNPEELFYSLHKDSTYNFQLSGIGKTILTDYKKIVSVEKAN